MSLSKQLFIFITLLFCMIFGLHFGLSVNNAKSYLELEARGHAQDTATSLGLSLTPYIGDTTDPIMETMIKAIFDMGYYQEIKLTNVEGKTLVAVTQKTADNNVPSWFSDALPMPVVSASSEINDGWSQAGKLEVTMHSGNATAKLFQLVKNAFIYSLLLLLFALVLLSVLLHFMLAPLKKINQLALTIADGKFATLSPLPWTKEVRNVAISMNRMSQKLEGVILNAKAKLGLLSTRLRRDDLTGFKKKSCFDNDIKQLSMDNHEAYLLLVKVAGLTELVKEQGAEAIDRFLANVAEKLRLISEQSPIGNVDLYRFVGSEFMLLAKEMDAAQVEQLAQDLTIGFTELSEETQRLDIAHIGIAAFEPLGTISSMLAATQEAVEQAQTIGANRYYFRRNEGQAKDTAAWKTLVFDTIDKHGYSVSFRSPIADFKSAAILMEDAVIQAQDDGHEILPIGTFVAIAEKFSKIVDLDRGVTQKVLAHIHDNHVSHAIAVSLSTRTVKNPAFRSWLAQAIGHKAVAQQLIFSFSTYAVAKEIKVYKEFFQFVHSLGAKIMLKRFEMQFLSLEMASALKVDFVRLPRDLSLNLANDERKRHFVATLQELAVLLDMPLLAENVQDEADFQLVQSLGLTGASR